MSLVTNQLEIFKNITTSKDILSSPDAILTTLSRLISQSNPGAGIFPLFEPLKNSVIKYGKESNVASKEEVIKITKYRGIFFTEYFFIIFEVNII